MNETRDSIVLFHFFDCSMTAGRKEEFERFEVKGEFRHRGILLEGSEQGESDCLDMILLSQGISRQSVGFIFRKDSCQGGGRNDVVPKDSQ